MDEWMDEWMDGWINGWMDGWMGRSHVRRMARLLWGWRSYVDECIDERLVMTRLWRRTVVDGAGG